MEALKQGLDVIEEELAEFGSFLSSAYNSLDASSMQLYIREKLKERIDDQLSRTDKKTIKSNLNVKDIVEKQQNVFKEFMTGKLLKPNKKCLQCTAAIKHSNNSRIYSTNSETNGDIPNGIESLVDMLHLPCIEIQRYIIELIFELFYLTIPEWTDDFEVALISADTSSMQDSWHLYDGFVVTEGKSILPFITKNRLNLLNNYLALVLHAFIHYGLIEALVSVNLNPSDSCCSVTACWESSCICRVVYCRPTAGTGVKVCTTLMTASMSSSPKTRELANASITNLNRIHEFKKRGPIPCSLYLDQLLQFFQLQLQNH